ncbi:hypothetical protein QQS21_005710 [Conoideocrella luteorostrata]|uniref:Uncharacterized protein n=1 Tax=Conoideocrella luteorostrata TaxID=1105319 RepID=A0AAJ0CP84_9HYPO|nr:hypothetical protein QQS21_005710 [Conoideocrella luteorostrata]
MVNILLWMALCFSVASAYGSIILPRAPDGSLAALIRNSPQVRGHMKSIIAAMDKLNAEGLPYSEGPLQDFKSVDLDKVAEEKRKCLRLRNSVRPEGFQAIIDINPHADYPDQISGDEPESIEITTSLAKVDNERLGWNKEVSTEIGGSATAEASGGFGPFSASLSATVFGNQRSMSGKNGESSKQTEYRNDIKVTKICKRNSICRVVTWTYTRTIMGRCFLMPYQDLECWGPRIPGNISLGVYLHDTSSLETVAKQFFEVQKPFNSAVDNIGAGFTVQGIQMHSPDFVKAKYEENCSFSYPLRMENGDPVRAQALITEPLDTTEKSPVQQVPKAYKWVQDAEGIKYCNLEKGWSWQPDDFFYIPKAEGGRDEWEQRPDLPQPEGHKEKCPRDTKLSARAEASGKNAAPPKNKLIKVEIISDNVPKFVSQLGKNKNEGFVANL